MTDQFSADQPGPAARFKPGPGQLGEHAALQTARQPAGRRPSRQPRHPAEPRERGSQAHRQESQQQPDQRHLLYGLMHVNAQGLGRGLPFGLWALHNGYFPELAPGKQPVDWLD